ncbi:Na+/H+ antiporter [Mucilaginibacter ginkgonis]|uniref:Na+/H+ antiporter n=1 Tax=Mucilaginibacter ginkgonis TaxID=2682091 RepID=A0A6I4HVM3_9SPHI|nr:Na+/H+ antiporter [Mucilaginibacter ginkgonis]QQL50012.1 Na+/H+ antiporter [Mucilaginibacter ginkgonis]
MHHTSLQTMVILYLGLIFTVAILVVIAQKIKIAYPVFLVIAGLALSFIPAVPKIHIDPELVFVIILPPILFDASHQISLKGLWKWRRVISVMAFGFVLFTATLVAFISHWLIPGFPLAEGFMLGAIISPPDAAAAMSVLSYTKLPKTTKTILEGESLLNDATSLTLFRFALIAATSTGFVWHQAVTGFAFVVISGIGIGLAFGMLYYVIYKWLPTNANLDVAFSLTLPYLIYITAESVHSSGVLAVVTGGLLTAYQIHFVFSHQSRLKSAALWSSIVFIFNAIIFFLIGLQLPEIAKAIKTMDVVTATEYALIITFAVIVIRLLSSVFSGWFTAFISKYITVAYDKPGWRGPFVVGWAGMRGVVSLASASAIPLLLPGGQTFPFRNLILFITFVVILITLVGQGLTLPWIVKIVRPGEMMMPGAKPDNQQLFEMELELYTNALDELETKHTKDTEGNKLLQHRKEFIKNKLELLTRAAGNEEFRDKAVEKLAHYRKVMINITERERRKLHEYRRKDGYDDDIIHYIERRLDLEEEQLEGEE